MIKHSQSQQNMQNINEPAIEQLTRTSQELTELADSFSAGQETQNIPVINALRGVVSNLALIIDRLQHTP